MSPARKRPTRCGCARVRLGLGDAPVQLAAATSVRDILTTLGDGEPPALLVIDSIQTMHTDLIEGAPGTVSQVRASAQELIRFAKAARHRGGAGRPCHQGRHASPGPRVLEHMVDTVLGFEGERSHQYRILRASKNRFGGTDEIGVFAMEGAGLAEVANPSALFLTQRGEPVSGTSGVPGAGGHAAGAGRNPGADRAAGERGDPAPRRGRLGQRAAGDGAGGARGALRDVSFATAEVYLNVAGGYRLTDPAADLAVAAALVSALSERPVPADAVVMGEVALSGEVRPVGAWRAAAQGSGQAGLRARLGSGRRSKRASGDGDRRGSPSLASWSTRSSGDRGWRSVARRR